MGLPENINVWINSFLGNRRLLADFSILVLAWHSILARASTSGSSIHFWLEHPLLARASITCPCLFSSKCSTRFTTTSPLSIPNKKGLAVHSPDVHSQMPFSSTRPSPRVFIHVPFRFSKHGLKFLNQTRPKCGRDTGLVPLSHHPLLAPS